MSTGAFLNENSPLVFSTRTFSIIYDEQRILRLCALKTDEIHVNKEILSVMNLRQYEYKQRKF